MPTKANKAQDRIAELQLAELQGRQAYMAGEKREANPYPSGDERLAWFAGYRTALEDSNRGR